MVEEWDEYAQGWDSNEDVIAYSEKAFKSLLAVVNVNGLRILDFGCGTGLLTEKISPLAKEIVALDSSKKMISILNDKKLPNVTAVSEELTENLVKGNKLFLKKFDLIVASSVCSFLSEYEKTLGQLKTLLVPGGSFVQWDWLATDANSNFGLSREQMLSAYNKTGLKVQALEKVFSFNNSEGDLPVIMGVTNNS